MPDRSDKVERLNEQTDEYELPYLSKSRLMTWYEVPEHFRLKYLEGIKEPENQAMRRGTDIHESFEAYYEHVLETESYPPKPISEGLPDNHQKWADYLTPYVANFFVWEHDRWLAAGRDEDDYLPISIEEEIWTDSQHPYGGPEWMGLADVIVPSASVRQVEADEGVTIIDFKTGKVSAEKYRHPGIYTELEYYTMLFEEKYNVTGAAIYYPKEHEVVTLPQDEDYRSDIIFTSGELLEAAATYDGGDTFDVDPGPLCQWSFDDEDSSAYYGVCSQCTWAEPARNEGRFRELIEKGYSDTEIAEEIGCEPGESSYWRWKIQNE